MADMRSLGWYAAVGCVVVPLSLSCSSSGPACDSVTCAGCCGSDGICRPGTTASACGINASDCIDCGAGFACVAGCCVAQPASGGGSAQGGGSGTGGGAHAGGGAGTGGSTGAGGGTGTGGAGTGGSGTGGASTGGGSTGGGAATGGGATGQIGDGGYPAPHDGFPVAVSSGGPVLVNPKLVSISFSNDDPNLIAGADDFISKIGATQYWSAVTSEYGIQAATAFPPVHLSEQSEGMINDSDIQSWLNDKLNSPDGGLPPADSSTIYTIFYPAAATINLDSFGVQCLYFGGYHESFRLNGNGIEIVYAVIPRCPGFIPNATDLDCVTGATSHELV